jgi:hypothetical protein
MIFYFFAFVVKNKKNELNRNQHNTLNIKHKNDFYMFFVLCPGKYISNKKRGEQKAFFSA